MTTTGKYVVIQGEYAHSVLGTFRIIRGFAPLQELAEISAPYEMATEPGAPGAGGYQRSIDLSHAEDIKRYLERGELRFLPEIILSIRAKHEDQSDEQGHNTGVSTDTGDGLLIRKRWSGAYFRTHQIWVERSKIAGLKESKRIRRIDGNHRMHLAAELLPDDHVPTKYLVPFCAVLLAPPDDPNDDVVEAMLFHTINSTALPLDSEHALKLILNQPAKYRPTPDEEFASNPALHLTRLLSARIDSLPEPQKRRLGDTPLTTINAAARALVGGPGGLKQDRATLKAFADELHGALVDVLARMPASAPELCKARFFVELASLVWTTSGGADQDSRVADTTATLDGMARWLGQDGLEQLDDRESLARQLLDLYTAISARCPRRVFLARWYPGGEDTEEVCAKAKQRLQAVKRAIKQVKDEHGVGLELIDLGSEKGGTKLIPAAIAEGLEASDVVVVDLYGVRPNVCIEAGYALANHSASKLVFFFTPSKGHGKVPFDLQSYRYHSVRDSADIQGLLLSDLVKILRDAGAIPEEEDAT